jgi:PAS domain S-box-containing protein
MAKFGLPRLLERIGSIETERRGEDPAQKDARLREAFGLSRWFAGIGSASAEARRSAASPEADARVRKALDCLPVTLFEFDSDGIYTCVGGRYVGLFGISAAEIVGRSVFSFPRLVPGKNMMVRRALAGEAVAFTGIWPLGRFMIRLQPRFDAAGHVVSVVGMGYELAKPAAADKQIQQLLEALRQSEARFRAMCESAPLGIFVSNEKLELGYVNPALSALVGRRPDELLGRHWQTALHAEREPTRADHGPGTHGSDTHDGVLRLLRSGGSPVWTALRIAEMREPGGELLGYVGAITDVTRERAARLAADRAQRDLRRVIESSPEGIAVVRDGCWIFVNRALAEALGYACPDDLVGHSADAIVHPDDRTRALELTARPRSAWVDGSLHEVRYRRASGDYAWMEMRPAPLTEFEGAPAVLITARDVTERRKLQAQLLVSERLLSVGTLAAGVAHEINNPLAAVMSSLDWVVARLSRLSESRPESDLPEVTALRDELRTLDRPIGEAREAAGRMRAIVRDLKLFSRADEELIGPVALTPVLDSAARMAWNEVRHRARFVREYGELPTVQGSEARLGQVFLNLIINAAQAIPEGHAGDHEIRLSARALVPGQVVVEVHDSGSGIPADIIGRIFDPFFTTKPLGVGTGLGLAICHRIVTSMGGHIDVESQPGRGSAFRVTLASAPSGAQPHTPAPAPALPPSEARGRVLVIDDDPALLNAIGLVLGEDHEVEALTSARRALALLSAGERYDAIVCDVMMPEMSGADFHSALASVHPELATEVIFLTGGAFTLHAREFLDRVPNPRLDKPFDSNSLRALVNRQVSRSI